MKKVAWIILFLCTNTIFTGSVSAQTLANQPNLPKEIIITASKIEEDVKQTGSSVIIITSEEIDRKRYASVLEALRRKTGIGSASNGPFGGSTDIFLRGANAAHTLVMIDGVRIYDAITADANYDLAHLPLDNVERIEIIKGPQSSLYGSDAMGGVINIITRRGQGKPRFFVSTEVGTKDTYVEALGGQGNIGKFNYSLDASHQVSDGISKARDGGEADSYEKSSISSKMSYQLNDDLEVGLQGLYLYARSEGDDGSFQDDPNRLFEFENSLATLFTNKHVNEFWDQKLQYSWFRNIRWDSDDKDRVDTTEDNRSKFTGRTQNADWQHTMNLSELFSLNENVADTLIFGFQYSHEYGESQSATGSTTALNTTNTAGYYFENKLGLDDKMFWTLAFRTDDHSRFGLHTTGRSTFSYLFETDTRLKGSYGTGFNAPSLFQLFSDFGNANLSAGTSWGYDVGLEQELFDNKVSVSALFFLQRFKDLIEFESLAVGYVNRGSARTRGIESEFEYRPLENFTIGYGFTYLEARDLENNRHLRRRPNLKHNISFDLAFWDQFNWNVDVVRNLKTYDPAATRLKDYTVVDMALNYAINADTNAYLKIDNIFDAIYHEIRGFTTAPRLFRVGAKVTF